MNRLQNRIFIILALAFNMALVGCASKKQQEQTTADQPAVEEQVENVVEDTAGASFELQGDSDTGKAGGLQTVYFDFDSSELSMSTKDTLDANVEILKLNSMVQVQVEGHCDERGGVQYNLALGERRANSVRDYLIANGIPSNRITTVSYGKEKPVAFGHDESTWSQNRRSNFVITAK